MAWTSGFFNSVNGDRLYNAQQMSEIFEGLITDGVYESVGNKMAVQPNSGMTIQIATGRGWFGKHWVNNDSEFKLTVSQSDVILNRYVAVVIRVDDTDAVRDAVPYLKYSDFATTPVKPAMTRTETIKEYCLAYIYQKAGVTTITAGDIEDTRANTELCGWVTGLIEQLSSTTLFEQFTGIFYDWFNNLTDKINENTETMLVGALPTSVVLDIPVSSWSGKTATVNVSGMNTTKTVLCSPADNTKEVYSTAGVRLTGQNTGTLTFTCETAPSGQVSVNIVHMGV
jgi:hypothetical protein